MATIEEPTLQTPTENPRKLSHGIARNCKVPTIRPPEGRIIKPSPSPVAAGTYIHIGIRPLVPSLIFAKIGLFGFNETNKRPPAMKRRSKAGAPSPGGRDSCCYYAPHVQTVSIWLFPSGLSRNRYIIHATLVYIYTSTCGCFVLRLQLAESVSSCCTTGYSDFQSKPLS